MMLTTAQRTTVPDVMLTTLPSIVVARIWGLCWFCPVNDGQAEGDVDDERAARNNRQEACAGAGAAVASVPVFPENTAVPAQKTVEAQEAAAAAAAAAGAAAQEPAVLAAQTAAATESRVSATGMPEGTATEIAENVAFTSGRVEEAAAASTRATGKEAPARNEVVAKAAVMVARSELDNGLSTVRHMFVGFFKILGRLE